MSENNCLELNSYMQQHNLLTSELGSGSLAVEEAQGPTRYIPNSGSQPSSQHAQYHSAGPTNSRAPQPPVSPQQTGNRPQAEPLPRARPHIDSKFIFRVTLDYALIFFYTCKYALRGTISSFALAWLCLYACYVLRDLSHWRIINRGLVVVMFLEPIIKGLWQGWGSLNVDEVTFMLVYVSEIVPFFLTFCCACCLAGLACSCATFCLCWFACYQSRLSLTRYLENMRYNKQRQELISRQITEVADRMCPICLETGGAMNMQKCHHCFHPECLKMWLGSHRTCPVCRALLY